MENAVNSSHFIPLPSHALCLDQLYFSFCTTLYNWVLPGWPKKKMFFDFRYCILGLYSFCQRWWCTRFAWLHHVAVYLNCRLYCTTDPYLPCLRRGSKIVSFVFAVAFLSKNRWYLHLACPSYVAVHLKLVHCTLVLNILVPAWPQQMFGKGHKL